MRSLFICGFIYFIGVKSECHFTGAALEAPRLNHLSVSAEQNLTGQAESTEFNYFFPFTVDPSTIFWSYGAGPGTIC